MKSDAGDRVCDLVQRARDRRASIRAQHAAYTILVRRFEAMAFATALRASEDVETARDACQEAFLLAWRTLPDLREPAAFGGWLKQLVRTQCSRTRRRRCGTAFVAEGAHHLLEIVDEASDPAELANRHETIRWILRVVDELPAEEREAITRFYLRVNPCERWRGLWE
jgi:RNA polymerase sigma factor (sigma-70 family)